jgi:hypothetical protein
LRGPRLQAGARLGVQPAAQSRHPIEVLFTQRQPAPPGAIRIAEVAVGVEAIGEPVGELRDALGAKLGGSLGQMGFGGLARQHVDAARQPLQKAADHPYVGGPDAPGSLRFGGSAQQWRQWLAGQRAARA